MNYTLKQLQDSINNLIQHLGEDSPCAAWIYTVGDCYVMDEDGNQEYPALNNPELAKRIFNQVEKIDHISEVIIDYVEDVTEEQYMLQQQEFDNSCPYCGGDCYNDHDNACDGFLGDIDELVQQELV